jgi:hypothetical protein
MEDVMLDFATGLPVLVKDWILNSKSPAAEEWRRRIRERAAWETDQAIKRQRIIYEQAKDSPPAKTKQLRVIATIDPVIADNYRRNYGSACLNDPEFIADCRKTAPELFVDGK